MTKIQHIPQRKNVSSTPSTPDAGFGKIYQKTDLEWYGLDENGNEVLLSGSGGSGTLSQHFVFRPGGGIDEGIVYDDFHILMEDLESIEGPKFLWFDRLGLNDGDPIEIPVRGSGAWDFSNVSMNILLASYDGPNASFGDIQVLDGNTWSNLPVLVSTCVITFNNTGDPVITLSDDGVYLMTFQNAAGIANAGTIEAIQLEGSTELIIGLDISEVQYDSYEVINAKDTSNCQLALIGQGQIQSNVARGEAGATLDLSLTGPKGTVSLVQTNFVGTLERSFSVASRIVDDTLPDGGTITVSHYMDSYNMSVEVWMDDTVSGSGWVQLGDSSITVTMTSTDDMEITDHLGLGGVNIKVIMKKNQNQITI